MSDVTTAAVRVSVVVATYCRIDRLGQVLDALAAQTDAPSYEVIVVDDASPDNTQEFLAERQKSYPVPLRFFRQESNSGPPATRNRGWRASAAEIVCFTDDDCIPGPTWLSEMVAQFDSPDRPDIVQGKTVHNRDEKQNVGPWTLTINVWEERGFYETCNIGYRREWLERCGGFDETMVFCGEDADLAWRAKKQGARSTFAEDAIVRHAVWPSEYRRYFRSLRRNRGMVPLVARHPQLRREFPRPWLYKTSHVWAIAVAGTSVVALARPRRPWSWVPVLFCVNKYRLTAVETRHRPRRRQELPLWIAQGLVADWYEVSTLLAASARYRTLLV